MSEQEQAGRLADDACELCRRRFDVVRFYTYRLDVMLLRYTMNRKARTPGGR
jgi:hypothetical protein